jgi:hypothetical protein
VIVTVASEAEYEDWYDACYVAGFDDGWAARPPCQDCGDMEQPYLEGYADGVNSRVELPAP